jgi:hypothetical protein
VRGGKVADEGVSVTLVPTDPPIVEAVKARLIRHVDRRKFGRVRWIRKVREVREYGGSVRAHARYVLTDPELDNYSYDLGNDDEVGTWLEEVFEVPDGRAALAEARCDTALRARVDAACARRRWSIKQRPGLGRRLGWYAIVRQLKPRRVVETGTHDGLGSLVLLAALARNAEEGHDGRLVSLDIDPHTGWMVGPDPRFERVIGPTRETLPAVLEEPADLFLHDSDHRYDSEYFELDSAARAGVPVLLSDHSQESTALADVCREHGGHYSFIREVPRDHFYPGAGIGAGLFEE